MRDIKDIINDVPQWKGINNIEFEPLNGGLTNATYKVQVENQQYVIRMNGIQNDYLKLKRAEENVAISKAAELGLAPKLISNLNETDYMITEFIEGYPIKEEIIHSAEMINHVTDTLKKIHSIDEVKRESSPFDLINNYLQGAINNKVILPEGLTTLLSCMEQIRTKRSLDLVYTKKYCHNDFHTGYNMLYNGKNIIVLDWELSGIGDVYFDLATISSDNRFDENEDIILLKNYFGAFEREQLDILKDMKFVCMLREAAWALFHSGIEVEKVNHDMDYYKFANWVINRLNHGYITF